jgi:hypothetical protein
MKSPGISTSAWLLTVGTAAILLIGALARFGPATPSNDSPASAPAEAEPESPPESAGEPALPADLSPGLAEIIRLAKAHVDQEVILAFIQDSGQVYAPTAEEILYLSDLGLPQNVIAALFKVKPASAPRPAQALTPAPPDFAKAAPPPPPTPPAPTADSSFFYDDLAPYGAWVDVPDYGQAWQPTVETIDFEWRPYLDHGQWVDSDSGWYWQSDYSWGWAVFHYGRWVKEVPLGWVWVPDKTWAPAWVAWRSTGSYFGWAPLPPGVSLNVLGQLTFRGHLLGAGFAFPPSSFAFVSANNFLDRNLPRRAVPPARAAAIFAGSSAVENYSVVNNKIINGGISRDAVADAVHKTIQTAAIRSVSSPAAVAGVLDRATLAVYQPAPSKPASSQASPYLINKPHQAAAAAADKPLPAEAPELPDLPALADSPALPALMTPLLGSAPPPGRVTHSAYAVSADDATAPRPVHHREQGGLNPVERPAAPPPRLETGAAPSVEPRRAVEEPRRAVEEPHRVVEVARAAPPEARPAAPEPARVETPSASSTASHK